MNFKEACYALDKVEVPFFKNYRNEIGLSYLAVVKVDNSYKIELGYNKNKISLNKVKEIEAFIKANGKYKKRSFWKGVLNIAETKTPKVIIRDAKEIILTETEEEEEEEEEVNDLHKRYRVKNSGFFGSIGCIFSSVKNSCKEFYLISNAHVIGGKTDDCIYNGKGEPVGKLKWQLYDASKSNIGEFDVAIAKIENNSLKPFTENNNLGFKYDFNHNQIESPNLDFYSAQIRGGRSGWEDATLYALKALVKVGTFWCRNQLLFDCKYIKRGDSGSVFVNKANNKIVGLYIGKTYYSTVNNMNLRIANNVFNLFNNISTANKPKINIEKFY